MGSGVHRILLTAVAKVAGKSEGIETSDLNSFGACLKADGKAAFITSIGQALPQMQKEDSTEMSAGWLSFTSATYALASHAVKYCRGFIGRDGSRELMLASKRLERYV